MGATGCCADSGACPASCRVRSRSFVSYVIDSDSDSDTDTSGSYAKTPKSRVQCMCALCNEADEADGAPVPAPGDETHRCYTKEVWSAEKQEWCCANKQLGCPPREDETPTDETLKAEAPKTEAPKGETPKAETPKDETPKAETPKDETPKTATLAKAGSCSCMGYNADGSTVSSGECGWASQQQAPGNSCMQVSSEAECVVVPAEVSAGITPAATFKLGGKCD